jgi:DNA-binding transcriptional MocR family regulator
VRALAAALPASPATVSSAYRTLHHRGLVIADGRRGTRVAPRPAVRVTRPAAPGSEVARTDLTTGLPDPTLLPSLASVLDRIDVDSRLSVSERETLDARLLDVAARGFTADGVDARAITVVGGAMDGIERVLESHLAPGDRVAIEDPAYPPFRDLMLALGLPAVPVRVDDRGVIPDSLQAALARGVEGMLIVPRAQNPFGSALDPERAADLKTLLLERPDLLIIEDDHAGPVAGAAFTNVIPPGWPRWAVIRSVSKALHPDLRLALLAGDETTVARVEGRQALGPGWVSRLLQTIAAELLADPGFESTATRARDTYARRRQTLISALAERGLPAHGRTGMNVWIPVRGESAVISALLDAGRLVAAGERFRIETEPAIRVTTSTLSEPDAIEIARIIAAVEHGASQRTGY